ncbi:MAG: hypothetical protein WA941_02025 [Nitrososphaeraceae archaeon]
MKYDNNKGLLLSLAILISMIIINTVTIEYNVYAQNSTSNQTGLVNQTESSPVTTSSIEDFETLKQQYLSQWENIAFQPAFETFVADGSVQGYGVYREQPSNIFVPGETIVLYVEPVGYAFKEGVDREGNILHSYNLTANIIISDNRGNQLTDPISIESENSLNSFNKELEAFLPVSLTQSEPFPVGEYTIAYTITDGVSGESFDIVKDIRIVEALE